MYNKQQYKVKKTTCYPRAWKVYLPISSQEDNSLCNFFLTEKEAKIEANKRNKKLN